MSFELSGVEEMIATVERIGKNVEKVKRKALNEGAKVIQEQASINAPRDFGGAEHLADNITISPMKTDKQGNAYVEVGPQRGDNNDFFYGKFLEFGTVKMSAKPFMEPAFIQRQNQALQVIAQTIRKEIENSV